MNEYKRVIIKLFPQIKGIDLDNIYVLLIFIYTFISLLDELTILPENETCALRR